MGISPIDVDCSETEPCTCLEPNAEYSPVSDLHSSPDNRVSDPSAIRIEDILAPRDAPEPAPAREGLPPAFRMRADAHYVELLDATPPGFGIEFVAVGGIERRDGSAGPPVPALVESIRRHGVLQPLLVQGRNGRYRLLAGDKRLTAAIAAGLRHVPCSVRHVDDDTAQAVSVASNLFSFAKTGAAASDAMASASAGAGGELARSLSALGVCANLLTDPAPALTRVVAVNLIRAEVWRASCLLQGSRVLRGEVAICRRPVPARVVVDRVLQSIEPECRTRGVVLDRRFALSDGRIHADEELLVCALSGLLMVTFGLVDSVANALVTLTSSSEADGEFTFAIAQDVVSVPLAWVARVEDSSGDRPGGVMAAVAMSAARRIVEACDGRMIVNAEGRGTEMLITMPTLP